MKVRDLMTNDLAIIDLNTKVADIKNKSNNYVVTKNGLFCGIITQRSLKNKNALDNEPVSLYMEKNPLTTHPDIDISRLKVVLPCIQGILFHIDLIPVISRGLVVGILDFNTIIKDIM